MSILQGHIKFVSILSIQKELLNLLLNVFMVNITVKTLLHILQIYFLGKVTFIKLTEIDVSIPPPPPSHAEVLSKHRKKKQQKKKTTCQLNKYHQFDLLIYKNKETQSKCSNCNDYNTRLMNSKYCKAKNVQMS